MILHADGARPRVAKGVVEQDPDDLLDRLAVADRDQSAGGIVELEVAVRAELRPDAPDEWRDGHRVALHPNPAGVET